MPKKEIGKILREYIGNRDEIALGESVKYFSSLQDLGTSRYSTHIVRELLPDGIPSCHEPMVKLEGKSGYVLAAHCFPEELVTSADTDASA